MSMRDKAVVGQYQNAIKRTFGEPNKVFVTVKKLESGNKRLFIARNGDNILIFDHFVKNNRHTVDLANFSILLKGIDKEMEKVYEAAESKKYLLSNSAIIESLTNAVAKGEQIF